MTIAAILKSKGSSIVAVDGSSTLAEVATVLAERGIGLVVVLGAGGVLEGVISERDVIRRLAADGPWALSVTVQQVMTRKVVTTSSRTTVDEAMEIMTIGGFRHLPVMDNGVLTGIISIRDVVRAKVGIQETEVRSLRAYVAGEYVAGHT